MRAMVLAAGLGTRLGALSSERPKPLLPICDIPVIRYPMALLAAARVREVAVNLHHLGEKIAEELGDGGALGMVIRYSQEPRLLGTGGGLRKLLEEGFFGDQAFLVLNGKVVADASLAALAERHHRRGALATLLVRPDADAERWGAIEVDEDGRLVRLLDVRSPLPPRGQTTLCMFTGIQVLEPALLSRLPPGESCIVRHGLLPALRAGAHLEGQLLGGYFSEHSTALRYLRANLDLLSMPWALASPPGPLVGVDESARVAQSAVLTPPLRIGACAVIGERARLGPLAVIGHHAEVAAGTSVTRSVVWPWARVQGSDAADEIVTPQARLRLSREDLPCGNT